MMFPRKRSRRKSSEESSEDIEIDTGFEDSND